MFAVPDRPLRIMGGEAIEGARGTEAFYSTGHEATAEQVISWYAMRWSVENTFPSVPMIGETPAFPLLE